jgi:flagellar biosynthesis protein FlhF
LGEELGRQRYTGPGRNKIVALVGPTGAGKTTTVAKLAANAALVRKQRVGLITTDTYRVGAVEQLRHYADLIGVPVESVSNGDEFAYAMNRFARYDLVLIDTAGRNPSDNKQISGLMEMFEQYDVEVHLAVPAATRSYELQEILARYEALNPAATIVTKYDEARVIGAVVNTVVMGKMPISFVTTGQRVPEDITRPRPMAIAQRVIDSVMQFAGPSLRRAVEAEYSELERAAG